MRPKAPKHNRTKPKYRTQPNKEEKTFREWVRKYGCLVCGKQAAIHHIISDGTKRITKDHWLITPLCQEHHQGRYGYHGLGSDAEFQKKYGIDLYQKAIEFNQGYREWRNENG